MITDKGTQYVDATEAAQMLTISRQHFYEVVRPTIPSYKVGARTRAYYKADDIREIMAVKEESPLPIVIHGIQKNFVHSLRDMNIPCKVENVGIPDAIPIPKDLVEIFKASSSSLIVKRGRLQGVEGTPYRLVTNWYNTRYADNELVEQMRRDDDADMPALMKSKYGVVIEHIEETISTRTSTPDERKLLKLRVPGAVFEIRRINRSGSGEVVMVSDLVLVARYFKLRYSYDTDHWKA